MGGKSRARGRVAAVAGRPLALSTTRDPGSKSVHAFAQQVAFPDLYDGFGGHGPVAELLAKVGTDGVTKLDIELQ